MVFGLGACQRPKRHRANNPFLFQVQKLQGILKPMMLRRLKEDVEKNLAPKEETIIEVKLLLCSGAVKSFRSVCRFKCVFLF